METTPQIPFLLVTNLDYPISLYAASKKNTEFMAHTYSYLYRLSTTGLRLFTVYGAWGPPDMVYFKFTQTILAGSSIYLFNYGNMYLITEKFIGTLLMLIIL